MDASNEDIEQFFKEAGWSYSTMEGEDWETRYAGTYSNHVFTVRMTRFWVYFYATLVNKIEESCRLNLFEFLAMLNYKVSFAKFSIDKSNRVCIGVEVPRENLQPSVFKDALNTLSYMVDEHFRELLNTATDPAYVPSLKREEASSDNSSTSLTTATDDDVDWSELLSLNTDDSDDDDDTTNADNDLDDDDLADDDLADDNLTPDDVTATTGSDSEGQTTPPATAA